MNYYYALDGVSETKSTEFYNPVTLKNNHFLHIWKCFSSSPFENNAVFTKDNVTVNSVSVNPNPVTSSVGQSVQFTANVVTTGFANKAVTWSSSNDKVTIDAFGKAQILEGATGAITITATSIFDNTKKGTATLNIAGAE